MKGTDWRRLLCHGCRVELNRIASRDRARRLRQPFDLVYRMWHDLLHIRRDLGGPQGFVPGCDTIFPMLLTPGLQIFHNGVPVELLHQVRCDLFEETWKVKPLFVDEPMRLLVMKPGDRYGRLHTQKAA